MPNYSRGDYVKIVENFTSHGFHIGTVVQITGVYPDGSYDAYGLDEYGDMDYWSVIDDDLEIKKPHSEEQGCDH